MLDFAKRKTDALRTSAKSFALVVATQTFTAIATGVAIGYLMTFPMVWIIASQYQPASTNVSAQNDVSIAKTFVEAFDDAVPASDRCVDPTRVFWFMSLWSVGSTAIGILFVTLIEKRRLENSGGWTIGIAIDGRPINEPADLDERRLVNIVEEVAIAFGTVAPTVFVLDHEDGINAFAAGLTPSDSILCVTLGALRHLDRDELQAIIAHEMSHLTHGDTLLGTRLTAILLGLQSIRVLAESLISTGRHTADKEADQWIQGYLMMVFGATIWPFGLFGTIAATALTMSLGRSQEELADAEAVAKTRHPRPLARAMRRIMGHPQRGNMKHPMTSLVAPMLFVERSRNHHWFSTHPPLLQRIAAIDPAGGDSPLYDERTFLAPIHNEPPHAAEILGTVFAGVAFSNEPPTSPPPNPKHLTAASLVVLSALSVCDGETAISDYEFMRGWSQLDLGEANRLAASDLDPELFGEAVESLASLSPPQKKRMLVAIASTISSDGNMSAEEAELLQTVQAAWQVS